MTMPLTAPYLQPPFNPDLLQISRTRGTLSRSGNNQRTAAPVNHKTKSITDIFCLKKATIFNRKEEGRKRKSVASSLKSKHKNKIIC